MRNTFTKWVFFVHGMNVDLTEPLLQIWNLATIHCLYYSVELQNMFKLTNLKTCYQNSYTTLKSRQKRTKVLVMLYLKCIDTKEWIKVVIYGLTAVVQDLVHKMIDKIPPEHSWDRYGTSLGWAVFLRMIQPISRNKEEDCKFIIFSVVVKFTNRHEGCAMYIKVA